MCFLLQMGYAKSSQTGQGLHLRQFARAFIIDDGTNRVVFVSADVGMIGHGLRNAVSLSVLLIKYDGIYK